MQPAPCNVCGELADRHRKALLEYHAAVGSMDELHGLPVFKEAARHTEEARARYLDLREELRKHVEEHG
jgi:hypothetical protein